MGAIRQSAGQEGGRDAYPRMIARAGGEFPRKILSTPTVGVFRPLAVAYNRCFEILWRRRDDCP